MKYEEEIRKLEADDERLTAEREAKGNRSGECKKKSSNYLRRYYQENKVESEEKGSGPIGRTKKT